MSSKSCASPASASAARRAAGLDETTERYFRYYSDSRPYLEQLNFRLFRLEPRQLHLNGGFATARWAGAERLLRPPFVSGESEIPLLKRIAPRMETLGRRLLRRHPDASAAVPVTVVGADASGIDVRQEGRLVRVVLPNTAKDGDHLLGLLGPSP